MKPYFILLTLLVVMLACRQPAADAQAAATRLVAAPKWQIKEILLDEAPVFKDGRHVQHLSGVRFDVYMDWVRFLPDGTFEGHFKDSTNTKKFQWLVYVKQNVLAMRDSATKTGGWNVYPRNVYADAFEMETRSTVYDPPRMTKVSLRFVKP